MFKDKELHKKLDVILRYVVQQRAQYNNLVKANWASYRELKTVLSDLRELMLDLQSIEYTRKYNKRK